MKPQSLLFSALSALLAVPLGAEEPETVKLEKGSPAPVFEVKDDTGEVWKSTDHVGKKTVVVFFYPVAFTGG